MSCVIFRKRPAGAWIVPLILTVVVLAPWIVRFSPDGLRWAYHLDADVYRSGAQAVLDGAPLYGQLYEVGGTALPFTYPPLAALLFTPLRIVPLPAAGALLTVLSLGCLWLVLAVTLRAVGADWRLAVWVMPVAALFEPVRDTVSFGQINLVLMALVVCDTLGRRRVTTGALAGLAAAVKLTPAVFILFFLLRRDYRSAAVMVFTAVAATLAAAAVLPRTSWTYFTDTLLHTGRIGDLGYSKNQSLAGVLTRLTDAGWADYVWLSGVAGVLAWGLFAGWRVRRDRPLLLAVVAMVSVLCSPVSWSHHWVWLIVVVLAAASRRPWLAAAAVVVSLLPPHALLRHDHGAEYDWGLIEHLLGNSFVILALAVLAVACRGAGGSGRASIRAASALGGRGLHPPGRGVGPADSRPGEQRGRGDGPADHGDARQGPQRQPADSGDQ